MDKSSASTTSHTVPCSMVGPRSPRSLTTKSHILGRVGRYQLKHRPSSSLSTVRSRPCSSLPAHAHTNVTPMRPCVLPCPHTYGLFVSGTTGKRKRYTLVSYVRVTDSTRPPRLGCLEVWWIMLYIHYTMDLGGTGMERLWGG